uniref:SHSP domain-containing protein n=1 Tax=Strigamia maritima TaxID=126957 RepID=T1IIM1_STRMM
MSGCCPPPCCPQPKPTCCPPPPSCCPPPKPSCCPPPPTCCSPPTCCPPPPSCCPQPTCCPMPSPCCTPPECIGNKRGSVCNLPTEWQIKVNVPDYKPNELCVKVCNGKVEIKGAKSLQCIDNSDSSTLSSSESFSERFCIPPDVEPSTVAWEYKGCTLLVSACKKGFIMTTSLIQDQDFVSVKKKLLDNLLTDLRSLSNEAKRRHLNVKDAAENGIGKLLNITSKPEDFIQGILCYLKNRLGSKISLITD